MLFPPHLYHLLLCGICQATCYVGMVALGPLNRNIPVFMLLWFAAFFFYVCSIRVVLKKMQRPLGFRAGLLVLAVFAVLFRVILWFSPPTLSDDMYRNVWEGRLVAAGMNPYLHAPGDPELAGYRDGEIYPHINHPRYAAIYPPVTQFVFGLAMGINPSPGCMKAVLGLFDLGCAVVIALILRTCSLPLSRFMVYAWHPLPAIEFVGSGHCDSIGIFFLLLGALFVLRGFQYAGAGVLALGALAKLYPVLFIPFICLKRPAAFAVCLIAGVIACAPFLDAGAGLVSSMFVYARDWYFNGSLYALLTAILSDHVYARGAAGFLFVVFYAYIFIRFIRFPGAFEKQTLLVLMFSCIGVLLLLSPVVYPWYLCWILPFLALYPNRAWLLLSAMIVVSYLVLIEYTQSGLWQEQLWVRLVQYVPFYALLFYDALRAKRTLACGVGA